MIPGVRVGASGVGSGPGLIAMHYTAARRHGVEVVYETKMLRLLTDDSGGVIGVLAEDSEGIQEIRAGGVVLACGGFEASSEMRSEHLGGSLGTGQGAGFQAQHGGRPPGGTGDWCECGWAVDGLPRYAHRRGRSGHRLARFGGPSAPPLVSLRRHAQRGRGEVRGRRGGLRPEQLR